MAMNWYLLHTNPRKELLVANQLQVYEVEVFFPTIRIKRGYNRGTREEALFPHYLFVQADLLSPYVPNLRLLPGVRTLVHFGGQPAIIADAVVDHIRRRVEANKASIPLADHLYRPGQAVRIRSGPLAGLDAVFQSGLKGSERAQVLLEVLGRLTKVELDVAVLDPI
jgi:transcriptional antiterminator RfaH